MTRPVVYASRFVPGYRVPVLEALNEALGGRLIVCAGQPPDASFESIGSNKSAAFQQIPLRNLWIGGDRIHAQPVKPILKLNPSVILAEESPRSVTLPLLLGLARRKGASTLLWGHFSSNNRPFGSGHMLDRYRLFLARRVDGCVCYTESIQAYLQRHVPRERLFTARNTLDIQPLLELRARLDIDGKSTVRQRLGLEEKTPVLVFVGRLIPQKRLDILLDAYAGLLRLGPVSLVIIGDGPERASIKTRIAREEWTNVQLTGAVTDPKQSAPYLYAADVMVCPGYVGLAVNHAFALGLPVVTQASPTPDIRHHSPEISYLVHGSNGLVAPYGDLPALVAAVQTVLADQRQFSRRALSYAQQRLRLNIMVDGLVNAIQFAES